MFIDANTRISVIIRENKSSIEAIATLAKPFEKLRNPVLRKVMASRTTIGEAARMGGCTLEAFAAALEPLGFSWENHSKEPAVKTNNQAGPPPWFLSPAGDACHFLDVRETISSGKDPLQDILKTYRALPEGGRLCIINTFIPYPLIVLLEKQGAEAYSETLGEGEYRTWFLKKAKPNAAAEPQKGNVIMDDEASFRLAGAAFPAERTRVIDVRKFEMPIPMQMILESLSDLPGDDALCVFHKRVPVHLLEELAGENYQVRIHERAEGDVRLLIHKIQ